MAIAIAHSLRNGVLRNLGTGDRLATGYLAIATLLLLIHSISDQAAAAHAIMNIVAIGVIGWTAFRPFEWYPARLLRALFPLLFIGLAYVQVGFFAQMLYGSGVSFDPLLEAWDEQLFGVSLHEVVHRLLPGRFWAELMHALYLLYYPLLSGSILFVWHFRPSRYPRFVFVFMGVFLTYVCIYVLFPATGPLEYRSGLFGEEVIMSRLVDFLFGFGIPSVGGAFPSSHVGQSVAVFMLLRPMKRSASVLVLFVIAGIAVSMVYGSIHYTVDAIAGIPTGLLFFCVWLSVWSLVERRLTTE